jgi:hypothetical protein
MVPAKAVSNEARATLNTNGLQKVLGVLAVLLGDEGPQIEQQELAAVSIELLWADAELVDGGPVAVLVQQHRELLGLLQHLGAQHHHAVLEAAPCQLALRVLPWGDNSMQKGKGDRPPTSVESEKKKVLVSALQGSMSTFVEVIAQSIKSMVDSM